MIILLPALIMIPVNILIIYNANREIFRARQMLLSDAQNKVDAFARDFNHDIIGTETYISTLTGRNYNYLKLSELSSNRSSVEYIQTETDMLNDFQDYLAYLTQSSNVVGITAYFPEGKILLGKNTVVSSQKSDLMRKSEEILKGTGDEVILNKKGTWLYFESSGESYLGRISRDSCASCLIVISLDAYMSEFNATGDKEENIQYFAINREWIKPGEGPLIAIKGALPAASREFSYGKNRYYNCIAAADGMELSFGCMMNEGILVRGVRSVSTFLIFLSLLSWLIGPAISLIFFISIEKPLQMLNNCMHHVRRGEENYRIPLRATRFLSEFDELDADFNVMLDMLEQRNRELYQNKIEEQKVQLRYLNQQIRPHFILNALNIIYTYDETEFPLMRKMVIYLTRYFRYLVNLNSDYVLLYQEMEFTRNYLEIQKVRYANRFSFFVEWEEELEHVKIPAVIIQTFVENSVKYAFDKKNMLFIIIFAKHTESGMINITVRDTGVGYDAETLTGISEFLRTRQYSDKLGVGVQNVVQRLTLLYGENYSISIGNAPDGGAEVRILLPMLSDGESDSGERL